MTRQPPRRSHVELEIRAQQVHNTRLKGHRAWPPRLTGRRAGRALDGTTQSAQTDPGRRNALMSHLPPDSQKWITTTHLDWLTETPELGEITRLRVSEGKVS